jgi:hypothetical protein
MLAAVSEITTRRQRLDDEWFDAVRAAHGAGIPAEAIGRAAGMSGQAIRQLLRRKSEQLELSAADLQAGDRIVAWRHGDGPVQRKRDWVVKCPLGPHPEWPDSQCIQLEKLPGHPDYELNLWTGSDWDSRTRFLVVRA